MMIRNVVAFVVFGFHKLSKRCFISLALCFSDSLQTNLALCLKGSLNLLRVFLVFVEHHVKSFKISVSLEYRTSSYNFPRSVVKSGCPRIKRRTRTSIVSLN